MENEELKKLIEETLQETFAEMGKSQLGSVYVAPPPEQAPFFEVRKIENGYILRSCNYPDKMMAFNSKEDLTAYLNGVL